MIIEFAGGAYETFSKDLNAQECVNFFTHVDTEGGVSKLSLRGTPGLKVWKDTGHHAEVRGCHVLNGNIYTVVGNRVYRITKDKISTLCTGTLATHSGSVSMAANYAQVMIVDGTSGYIVTGTTCTKITDDGFILAPTSVTYQDGYFIANNADYAQISDLDNGLSWDSTMVLDAEGYPDDIIAVISDHRDLFIFGADTIEVWYNSGATVPFDRKPGTTQQIGIGARRSVAQLDNTVFFLTDDFQVARFEGYNPRVISTRAIEHKISQYSKKDDAIAMAISIEGNAFYVLTFPTANETWCYNAASTFWHKLTSYPNEGRWRGNCYANLDGLHLVGDYDNGIVYEIDFNTFTDNSETIRRIRTASSIQQEGKEMFHHNLEIFFESGVGLATGQGSDPQAMLQYSNDGGHTWSSELWRGVGKIGKYEWRGIWHRLGSARHRNYRLIVTDPVKWVVTSSNLEASLGSI